MTQQQAEDLNFKLSTVSSFVFTIVIGMSGMLAMQSAGITKANLYTDQKINTSEKETDLKIKPIAQDVEILKKKVDELQHK